VAFAGDATHDLSSFSMFQMKRHRSKRLNRQRRDVVGFSNSLRELETISDSDSDSDSDEIDAGPPDPSFSYSASNTISFDQDNVLSRLDKMSIELDSLVRFVRRGVENLSGGSGDVALTFGILAFNLEDWDRG
jgi:gamma-tubulin complex component 5